MRKGFSEDLAVVEMAEALDELGLVHEIRRNFHAPHHCIERMLRETTRARKTTRHGTH